VDARKGEMACTIQADETAVETMSRHGEDECLPQENREVHLEKVAVKVITLIAHKTCNRLSPRRISLL